MKGGREHRVPLCARCIAIVETLYPVQGCLVFPGRHGRALGPMTFLTLLARMNRDVTAHGFRSSFRDWCAEQTNYPNHVAEMALAHAVGSKVETAYRRGDLFDKRRALMDSWSAYCEGEHRIFSLARR
jgi:integrase